MQKSYFKPAELACSCCGKQGLQDETIIFINNLRRIYGKPLIVTSAFRCAKHPVEAAKKQPGSHYYGLAVDFNVSKANAYKLIFCAMQLGASGIGISQKGVIKKRFIHIDLVFRFDGKTVWSY